MKRAELIAVVCIIFFGGAAYLNSLTNPFIWDDIHLISTNLHISDLHYIPKLFSEPVYHQDMIGAFYRPVLMASFALNHYLWGLDPFGYHLSNVIMHICNAMLIYGIIYLVFRKNRLAFLTAMLFVLHPIQTEAVTYISGRADPLSAFFCLLSLFFFIRYTDFDGITRKAYFVISVLLFMLALFVKEASAMFLTIFILYETCFRRGGLTEKGRTKYIGYLLAILVYAITRHFVMLGVTSASSTGTLAPLANRIYTIPLVIMTYLRLLVFPGQLHMEHSDFIFDIPSSFLEPRIVFAMILITAIAVFVWSLKKRSTEIFFGSCWFILLLMPVLNIVPINAFIAEHWAYLPSIGFFLVISWMLNQMLESRSIKFYAATSIIVLVIAIGTLTIKQNFIWKDPIVFYKYTLQFYPTSPRLLNNLGVEYYNAGLYDEAEKEYKKAIAARLSGTDAIHSYINLGSALYMGGKKQEAFNVYMKALDLDKNFGPTYWYTGNAHYRDGNMKEAIAYYKKAAELLPSNAHYWYSLGNAYLNDGQCREAVEAYKNVLKILPNLFEARVNLGTAYSKQGMLSKADEEYRKAISMNPDHAGAREIIEKIKLHLIDK